MIRRRYSLVAIVLLFLCGSLSAAPSADEIEMTEEDTVETVKPVSPRYPSLVITEDDIRKSGAIVLGEVLNWLPGLEVIDRGYLGSGKDLSFEGFPSDQLLILIDGVVVNDVFDGSFDINMIPLSAVEKVEVIRHPSLLDLDTRAPGGAISIHTKQHDGGSAFTRLTLAGGSFDTNYQEGLFRRSLFDEQVGLSIAFDRVSTSGFEMEKDHKAFQYHFRIDDLAWKWIDLTFSGNGTKSSGRGASSDDTTSVDSEKEFRHINIRAAFNTDGSLPLEVLAYLVNDREDSLVRDNSEATARRRGDRRGVRFKGQLRYLRGVIVSYGVEEEFNTMNGADDIDTFSLFTGATYHADRWPVVDFMVRWEREGPGLSEWSGGLTSSYLLNGGTSIFASIIDARQFPSFIEREVGWDGQPRNERVVEAGLSFENDVFLGSVTGFRRWSEPIDSNSATIPGSGPPREVKLGVSGFRAQMGLSLCRNLSFFAGYQGAMVENAPSGIVGLSVPRHHVTGRIELKGSFKEEKIGLSCNLAGNMVRGRGQAVPTSPPGDDNYAYVDLNTRFRIIDVTFFYTIRNAFDADYEIIKGFPMPGRVERFGLRWNFFN